jgi:hypothetical protein
MRKRGSNKKLASQKRKYNYWKNNMDLKGHRLKGKLLKLKSIYLL